MVYIRAQSAGLFSAGWTALFMLEKDARYAKIKKKTYLFGEALS